MVEARQDGSYPHILVQGHPIDLADPGSLYCFCPVGEEKKSLLEASFKGQGAPLGNRG